MSSILKTWFVPAVLALGSFGCIIVDGDGDDLGTLTVEWTLFGDDAPVDCRATGSDRLEIAIYDVFDDHVTTLYPHCDEFEISLSLEEGTYAAELTLVDSFNESVTTTQIIEDLDVIEDLDLALSVDFSPDSFL